MHTECTFYTIMSIVFAFTAIFALIACFRLSKFEFLFNKIRKKRLFRDLYSMGFTPIECEHIYDYFYNRSALIASNNEIKDLLNKLKLGVSTNEQEK